MHNINSRANAIDLLKQHGKSFNFARWFLEKDTGIDAARLYGFCRVIDDIVDEPKNGNLHDALNELHEIEHGIKNNTRTHLLVQDFIALCEQHDINRRHGLQLIEGVQMDSETVALQTQEDLIQYAYLVAGVVGLMMSPILKAPAYANSFAVDLGIGMQLTNIARDVLEDAKNGRRYIPGDWVDNMTAESIANPKKEQKAQVIGAVKRLLALAERYYVSGINGISYIPKKNQLGIFVAANVYKEIGRVIQERGYNYTEGRCVVPKARKLKVALRCIVESFNLSASLQPQAHESVLHYAIKDLVDIK
ncbi:phytoene/squalene synthase family protein [Glaciecola petra]|uniref:Phytoene/squalene synthase family protein n=1 Tax=Glaciecola petra TaxID=3075602 RepID=A0ABU2ZR65_9ALTE|nr:phytoene/squalene synthase family protein [Aestuariibacter sp. P117]MDT0594746.1 phytoene/squalene synthase family protein [Aestuariibacter sp. P117]